MILIENTITPNLFDFLTDLVTFYYSMAGYFTFHFHQNIHTIHTPGVHITKNPNFDPFSTFSYFHYKKLGYPNFL